MAIDHESIREQLAAGPMFDAVDYDPDGRCAACRLPGEQLERDGLCRACWRTMRFVCFPVHAPCNCERCQEAATAPR